MRNPALIVCLFVIAVITQPVFATAIRGIYLTQQSLENTAQLQYFIQRAKRAHINAFVIDLNVPTKRYRDNIALVNANHIHYIARIVMFAGGGTEQQIKTPEIWQKKYALVKQAVDWGANAIQLDYIRYSSKEPASVEHAKNIHHIIAWYKTKLAQQNIPLQVDVFGITSRGEEEHIGQNVVLFSQSVDAICPMVYPSHFVPFDKHFARPYETVHDALIGFHKQFDHHMPIKMYAYIELSNYHYNMSHEQTLQYIQAQLKATQDARADGWYAWSPSNRYDNLFDILELAF